MKILWFYLYHPKYDFDNSLHMKFAEKLSRHPGVDLKAYGPGLDICNSDLTPHWYEEGIDMTYILKKFKPDVLICNTKSRMFQYYNPHNGQNSKTWLPKGFAQCGKPKIMIEEDYHYEKDNDPWYKEMGFDLVLERHHSNSLRPHSVPVQWMPFSVDTDIFKPPEHFLCEKCGHSPTPHTRKNRIAFAGSAVPPTYKYRVQAINQLQSWGLIDAYLRKEKVHDQYVKCLQEYVCHLSGSSMYHITPAKMFEIMACGSLLLTNENSDLPLLFPKDAICTYRQDMSNLKAQALNIINNPDYVKRTTTNALACIKERHTHEQRIPELLRHIEMVKLGRPNG